MSCLEQIQGFDSLLTIWGNAQGQVDLEYQIDGDLGDRKTFGWIDVWLGDREVFTPFVGSAHGVLQPDFQGTASRDFHGDFGLYHAGSSGNPGFLGGDKLQVSASRYNDSAWFVWTFQDGARAYAFDSMGKFVFTEGEHWLPVDLTEQGADFNIKVELQKEMIAQMRNTLPDQTVVSNPLAGC